jgi:DinB superfamily
VSCACPSPAGRLDNVTAEHCQQCGFDGDDWTDTGALEAVAELPVRWASAISGLRSRDLLRRPVPDMWSIGEYTDHVRQVLFGMRFLLDAAVSQPGVDLGASPESRFDTEARPIEVESALAGIDREATALRESLSELPPDAWTSIVILDGAGVDPHWIVRHAVHDATHHLLDVQRLRRAL